jgi:hypothetical protein
MHKFLAGLVAGLAMLAAAPSAFGANVAVRVEGSGDTLVPRTNATTSPGTFTKDGDPSHSCSYTSAGGALERATAGDWSGQWFTFGDYGIQTVKGEHHAGFTSEPSGTYWTFWHNYRYSSTGVCTTELQEGDDVLFFPSCYGPDCDEPSPLRISSIPASARPGSAFDVKVIQYDVVFDENFNATTTEAPAAGATVSAGGRAFTAGADGVASVTVDTRSLAGVRAAKEGYVRTATETVCVDCAEGPAAATGGGGAAARDSEAPSAAVSSVRSGAVYSRRRAPRLLRGSVSADASGLHSVKLRLRRRVGGKCSYFSGRRETFRPMRCGRGSFFRIGDRADWSYLLPKRLGRGSYVLEVKAIDRAFNRGPVERVRFRVR